MAADTGLGCGSPESRKMYPELTGQERDEYVMQRILGDPRISVSKIGKPNQPVNFANMSQAGGVNSMDKDQLDELYRLLGMLSGMGR